MRDLFVCLGAVFLLDQGGLVCLAWYVFRFISPGVLPTILDEEFTYLNQRDLLT